MQLHSWFEPFAKTALPGASDWIRCIHRITNPERGKRTDVLIEVRFFSDSTPVLQADDPWVVL